MAQDAVPALLRCQLLRSLDQPSQEAGGTGECGRRPGAGAVARGDPERGLAGVADTLGNGGEQQRPAGDRLEVLVGLDQPREQVPPVVDERDEACGMPAAGEVMRREPAPAPLVLQLVEGILAVGAVAVELTDAEDRLCERRNESGVLVRLATLLDGGERQAQLSRVLVVGRGLAALDCASARRPDPAAA